MVSEFSIKKFLNKKEETPNLFSQEEIELPEHHFSDKDLKIEWDNFLEQLYVENKFIYNAINTFHLHKLDENIVEIVYSSDSAKKEFERIQDDFFNNFKRKVNNFRIEIVFRNDTGLKREILTKRKIFDKLVDMNPDLKYLDDLMQFDFN